MSYIHISLDNNNFQVPEKTISNSDNHDINIISFSEQTARKIDNDLAYGNDEASLALLEMVATQQKAIVQAMFGINSNPEKAIAQALYNSIDIYSQKLSAVGVWANGGVEMFRASLMVMFESLTSEGNSFFVNYYEDLFQLALLEIICNGSEYGLDGWYKENAEDIGHILESTGTGSHSLHEADYDTPAKLANVAGKLYDGILANGNIPPESFLGQILEACEKDRLVQHIRVNWSSSYTLVCPERDYRWGISPMLRLFLLSSLLEAAPEMTKESVDLILTGTVIDIDALIVSDFGVTEENLTYYATSPEMHKYTPLLYWLTTNTNWQIVKNPKPTNSINAGLPGSHQLDWRGNGIGPRDLDNLMTTLPGRALTQEEIEEINRIGDQVKMIQEALKYWIGLVRDEQLAIVRNIS